MTPRNQEGRPAPIHQESSTYQAILEEGRTEGAVAEAKKVLLVLGDDAFGPPDARTATVIERIDDLANWKIRSNARGSRLAGRICSPRRHGEAGQKATLALKHSQVNPGTSTPRSSAQRIASSYPASTWRITPMPGSLVSTRCKRRAASAVPSATTTMPACRL